MQYSMIVREISFTFPENAHFGTGAEGAQRRENAPVLGPRGTWSCDVVFAVADPDESRARFDDGVGTRCSGIEHQGTDTRGNGR